AEARRKDAVTAKGQAVVQKQIAVDKAVEAEQERRRAVQQQQLAQERAVRFAVANGTRMIDAGDLFGALPWLAEAAKLDHGSPARAAVHRMRIAATLQQCPRLNQMWFHKGAVTCASW